MSLKKLPAKSGVFSSPSLPEFFHTFSVIRQHKNYRKCMEDDKFSKATKDCCDEFIQLGRIS